MDLSLYYQFRMGQCSLSDENNQDRELFQGQGSEEGGSYHSKESCSEKDRLLWEHQLAIPSDYSIPDNRFWHENNQGTHPCFQQIAKDVTRTFPDMPYFGSKANLQKFERILNKIALYFPALGYTQGLNFVAGFLMISGCQQEECFKLLIKLMLHDRILAIGLFEDNFPLVKFYCQVFWQLLEKKMPKVYQLLNKNYITDDLWLFQWFISFFHYSFPLDFARRVWDFILCKKEMAPVLVALGIIKNIKKELFDIKFQDEIDFIQFVNEFKKKDYCKKYLDLTKIFSYANSITKLEIDKAIAQTKCVDNPYRMFFSAPPSSQKEQWITLVKRLESQRTSFAHNPQPIKYERKDIFQHLQRLILTKYKLYNSELKKQNPCKRSFTSNPFSIRTTKSNNNDAGQWNFNKKRYI